MKSGKDVSSTNARKPSPAKANQERLARDIQRYTILTKRINRVLSTDSPEWIEWVKDTVKDVGDKVRDATNTVVDKVNEGFNYVKDKVSGAYETASGWISDRIADVKDTYDKTKKVVDDFVYDVDYNARELIDRGSDTVRDNVQDTIDDLKDTGRRARDTFTNTVTNTIETIGGIINQIDIKMPSIEILGLEALGLLPELITGIKFDVANWFKFDVKEYQDTMKLLEGLTKPADMR